jgi:hypothetical protein
MNHVVRGEALSGWAGGLHGERDEDEIWTFEGAGASRSPRAGEEWELVRDVYVSGPFRCNWLLTAATPGLGDFEDVAGDSAQRL